MTDAAFWKRVDEALPSFARPTDQVYGNARVWLTDRWRYLVDEDTGKVLNIARKNWAR